MSRILEVPKIVRKIAENLSIVDYLNFSQYSDNVQNELKGYDAEYFKQRLEIVLIKYDPTYLSDLLVDTEPTNVFSIKKTNDPKSTVITILHPLRPYLDKIRTLSDQEVDSFDFSTLFTTETMASQDKAKILVNLSKFVKMDNVDVEYHKEITEKLRRLIQQFTKEKFDELIDNYHREEYSVVSLIVETLNILDQEDNVIEFFKQENRFPSDFFPPTIVDVAGGLQADSLDDLIKDLTFLVNTKSSIIDKCFGDQLPIMLMFLESLIQKNIYEYFLQESTRSIGIVPHVYYQLLNVFIPGLVQSENAGSTFKEMATTFINLYFEPLIERFLDEDLSSFEQESIAEIRSYEKETLEQEKLEKDNIYKTILTEYNNDEVKTNKFELLSSFTKIFNKSNKESNEIKFRVNFEVISKNLQNLKSFINFELCYQIIEKAKSKVEIISIFNKVNNTIIDRKRVNLQIESIYITLTSIISQYHVKPGFEKAMEFLNKYDPNEFKSLESLEAMNAVEPLVKFTELINVGDLIQQMLEIFYENELVTKRIVDKNDFLNNANQSKKQFETVLDNFVANGLNIGIDKLMDEIEFLFNTLQLPNDFNPVETSDDVLASTGPTKCAKKVVALLSNHINLLNGSTETSIIDIFQQEIGERFFRIIVKNIKKRQVSNTGSIILISDLNSYYDFILNTLKQKTINPYFVGLKEIGQLYLISTNDSKELGKLIGDLSKFNGIFKQEEIYEFVQKRKDWLKIKKDVEKAMYGLGLIDCTIM